MQQVALLILGKIWDLTFPIIKNLWTSSFVLFAGGLSLLLFSVLLPGYRRLEIQEMGLPLCGYRGESDYHLLLLENYQL